MEMSSLFLNNTSLQCKITPMTVMAILNHYQRRPDSLNEEIYPDYALGFLFGQKDVQTNTIVITDSFATVIRIDRNGSPAINEKSIKLTLLLHSRSNPKETMVGWYRTGLEIDAVSTLIHRMFCQYQIKFAQKRSVSSKMIQGQEFVHLLVDTQMHNNKLNIKAYIGLCMLDPVMQLEYSFYLKKRERREQKIQQLKILQKKEAQQKQKTQSNSNNQSEENKVDDGAEESANDSATSALLKRLKMESAAEEEPDQSEVVFHRFTEIALSFHTSEAETIGMHMIIKLPPEGDSMDSPALLLGDANDLELTLQSLLENLEQVEYYVQQVLHGEVTPDTELGWVIANAINSVPRLSPQKFEQMLSGRLQDLLMLVYLGKLTKAQLTIADRINRVLYSTVPK